MLSGDGILKAMRDRMIEITPFRPECVGPNSVDFHLGDTLLVYPFSALPIDSRSPPKTEELVEHQMRRWGENGEWGWLLEPGGFYLGITVEETWCEGFVPHIAGRSSTGRLGIEVHRTAGVGDNGFRGRWTLEITTAIPVIVYPGQRLLQVYFEECRDLDGRLNRSRLYGGSHHHYQGSAGIQAPRPVLD